MVYEYRWRAKTDAIISLLLASLLVITLIAVQLPAWLCVAISIGLFAVASVNYRYSCIDCRLWASMASMWRLQHRGGDYAVLKKKVVTGVVLLQLQHVHTQKRHWLMISQLDLCKRQYRQLTALVRNIDKYATITSFQPHIDQK